MANITNSPACQDAYIEDGDLSATLPHVRLYDQ
ncbi:hypothetical protein PAMH19_1314 [Pseudomonas aeruginosa]|nr:hypothetical protein PAMH19_1314 [Pseudomonas aeruginosa]